MPVPDDQESKNHDDREKPESGKGSLVSKFIKYTLLILVLLCLLLCILIASLPVIVSSERAKGYLEGYSTRFLKQPVSISLIRFSWFKGLLVEQVIIKDNPRFSDKAILSIDRIQLVPNPRGLINRELDLELTIDSPFCQLIRDEQGETNLEHMLSQFKKDSATESGDDKKQGRPMLMLPLASFDMICDININGLSLQVVDRKTDHTLTISDAYTVLHVPSLKNEPIDLEFQAEALMDDKSLSHIALLVNAHPKLENSLMDLIGSRFSIKGRFLETNLDIKGTLENFDLEGLVEINLSPVMDVIKVVSGEDIPDISGHVSIIMETDNPSDGKLDFKSSVNCQDIRVSGGKMKDMALGPVNISAEHIATVDIAKGEMSVRKGEISMQDNSGFSWAGEISLPKDSPVLINLSMDRVTLDLKEITSLTYGFFPIDASGNIRSEFSLDNRNGDIFDFKSHITGEIDSISGIPGVTGQVKPFDFDVLHDGTFDPATKELHVNGGIIAFLGDNMLEWNGRIKDFDPRKNTVDIVFGPCSLNMDGLLEFALKSIPEKIPAQFRDHMENLRGVLSFGKFHIQGPLASGQGRVEIKDLSFNAPFLGIKLKEQSLGAKDIGFHLNTVEAIINQFYPEKLQANFDLGISDIQVKGEQSFSVNKLDLNPCEIILKDLSRSSDSLFGFKGDVTVMESLQIEGLSGPSGAFFASLDNSLDAEAVFGSGVLPDINIKELNISSPSFFSGDLTPVSLEGDFGMKLGIRLNDIAISPDALLGIEGKIDITESLSSGSIRNSSKVQVSGFEQSYKGTLILEKDTIGSSETRVKFSSPWLTYQVQKDQNPATAVLFETEVKGFRLGKKDSISIDTDSLHMDLKTGNYLDMMLDATARGLGKKDAVLNGKFLLNLDDSLSLFRLDSLMAPDINGNVSIEWQADRLPGIDDTQQLLPGGWKSILANVLKGLGLNLQASIKSDFRNGYNDNIHSISVQGGLLDASTGIIVTKGESVNVRGKFASSGINLALGDVFQVKNLQTNLKWEKDYSLSFENRAAVIEKADTQHLSSRVLRPWSDKGPEVHKSSGEVVKGIRQDLINRKNPGISFDYAMINTGLIPVEIRDQLTEIRIDQGLPGIDYFQAHILGGSLQGYFAIYQDGEFFLLDTGCSFTGINPNSIIGGALDEEAELSGRLKIRLPVSDDFKQMIDELSFEVDLTHIGSNTLERFLYILDPNDSNETIVRQRQLLRIGTPRWVSLRIEHGNLAISGMMEVKGKEIALPPVDRFSVVNLPIWNLIEENGPYLNRLVYILRTISADRILLGRDGVIRLTHDENWE